MPHEPKRRHSIGRKGKRRASITLKVTGMIVCPNCGKQTPPHMVCINCGYYKGVAVVKKESKAKVTRSSTQG